MFSADDLPAGIRRLGEDGQWFTRRPSAWLDEWDEAGRIDVDTASFTGRSKCREFVWRSTATE